MGVIPSKREQAHFKIMAGLFMTAVQEQRANELPMASVQFQPFNGNITAFGTQNLRSCAVSMVASRYGVVMGHFPALGDVWVNKAMDTFFHLYRENRATCFPLLSEAWVILGITIDESGKCSDGMDSTSTIIFDRMVRAHVLKSDPSYPFPKFEQGQYYYKLRPAAESPQFPGKGSVFVDISSGKLVIYVEDISVGES